MMKPNKFIFIPLLILAGVLPFHAFFATSINTFLFHNNGTPPWFLLLWKEYLLFFIFGFIIFSFIQLKKYPKFDWIDKIILFYFFIGILHSFFSIRSFYELLLGIKYDYMFLFLFLLIKQISFNNNQKNKIIQTILFSASIIVFLGLFSYFFLPDNILTLFGYSDIPSRFYSGLSLPYCHLISETNICRLQATFSGPNQFATYLLIIIPLFFFYGLSLKKSPETRKNRMFFPLYFIFSFLVPAS